MIIHLESTIRVRIGDDLSTITNNRRRDGSTSLLSVLLVLGQSVGAVEVLVDHTSHAILTMIVVCLRAVKPDGLGVLDLDLEDIWSLAYISGLEARKEGVVVDGHTRLVKRGLSDTVCFRKEMIFDDFSNICDDVVGGEDQSAETHADGMCDFAAGGGLGWRRDQGRVGDWDGGGAGEADAGQDGDDGAGAMHFEYVGDSGWCWLIERLKT